MTKGVEGGHYRAAHGCLPVSFEEGVCQGARDQKAAEGDKGLCRRWHLYALKRNTDKPPEGRGCSDLAKDRKVNRKETIKAAAIELFAERGFQTTPTAEIAKRAGVSEGVIFYHFQTKEGILISLLEDIVNDLNSGMRTVLEQASSGLEAVLSCQRFHRTMIEKRSQEMLALARGMPFSLHEPDLPYRRTLPQGIGQLLALLGKAVERGKGDGSIRQCDPRKNSYMIMGMMIGMSRMSLLGIPFLPELEPDYLEFYRRALASDHA